MSLLNKIYIEENWNKYLLELQTKEDFIDKRLIKSVEKIIADGIEKISLESFPLASKYEISKYKTDKKRTIYSYGEPYNTYLKMINWLLQNDEFYRNSFCINSYAYQKNKNVSKGVKRLNQELKKNNDRKYYIKTDFSDYFNSIKISMLGLKMQKFFKPEDADLASFIFGLISEPNVYVDGKVVQILNKGVMAGTPLSGYLANIYMNDVDWKMYRDYVYYIRYADDIFILSNNPGKDLKSLKELIEPLDIKLNMKKTEQGVVSRGFSVLGFYFKDGKIDIDPAKIDKMKSRIKRRSKWFRTWASRKNVKNRTMVRTFVKGMNAKFYSQDEEDRMNWSRWYFPTITETKGLNEIDSYLVQYIRYLISGKHLGYKKHSEVSYEQVTKTGYVSLVNNFWRFKKKGVITNEVSD